MSKTGDGASDFLVHELIRSIQESLELAEQTARRHYSFSIAELEVTATLNFEVKESDTESEKEPGLGRRNLLSLFHRGKLDISQDKSAERDTSGKMTLRMLFKPGGKYLPAERAEPASDRGA